MLYSLLQNYTGIEFTVLENGLCIMLNEEYNLEIFSNNHLDTRINIINDNRFAGCKLFHRGNQTLVAKDNKLYFIRMGNEKKY